MLGSIREHKIARDSQRGFFDFIKTQTARAAGAIEPAGGGLRNEELKDVLKIGGRRSGGRVKLRQKKTS